MRATVMYQAGDVRVESVPDPKIESPTDAIVRVTYACICGSDLWPYKSMEREDDGQRMGHEFMGVIEDVGKDVHGFARGDLVIAPFVYSDGTCDFCQDGIYTRCRNGGFWGNATDGGQGEAVRVPLAQGTLVKVPGPPDEALMASLLSLSDVYCTGYFSAVAAQVGPRSTVAVVGDGAVGLLAVLSAKQLGASRIIILGHHHDRVEIAKEFGATDVVESRGEEATQEVLDLTSGDGAHAVLECVGLDEAFETSLKITRDGGRLSRVGVPQYKIAPMDRDSFERNITLTGGIAPARLYINTLLPDVLEGKVNPGRVFDQTVSLDGVPEGYRAMDERVALKVAIRP